MNDFLYTYSEDSYSENGEDGINKKILEHLGISEGVILEIGAWDGFFASNCANLWSKNKNLKISIVLLNWFQLRIHLKKLLMDLNLK